MEHLYSKYHGCGHADMTKWEFITGVHRDSYASHVGHFSRIAYMAVAENEPIAKTRFKLIEKMVQPCGPPPIVKDDQED
jgi:splicing factor 3B subunit 5